MGQLIQLKEENRDFDFYLSKLKDLSGNDLESINSLILEKIDSKIPLIQEIASHLILSGGKRLRPLLTSCCYNLCKKKDDNEIQQDTITLKAQVQQQQTAAAANTGTPIIKENSAAMV